MYIARKPFRYGNRIYMTGEPVSINADDVRMLQGQGKIGGLIRETAVVRPAEKAVREKPETATVKPPETAAMLQSKPKHLGGRKAKKKDLEAGD